MDKLLSFEEWMEENSGYLQDAYVEQCRNLYDEYLKESGGVKHGN